MNDPLFAAFLWTCAAIGIGLICLLLWMGWRALRNKEVP